MATSISTRHRVVIMGAAGRDFHNFNVVFRGDAAVEVVAFTAAQIPGIALGYGPEQLAALQRSIATAPVDFVVSGTPIDLGALINVPQPILRARYEFADAGGRRLVTSLTRSCEASDS